jgi:hypothetical protein
LSRREDYERLLASDYAHGMEDADASDIEWNLERLSTTDRETSLARDVLAPLALMRIDDAARAVSGGRGLVLGAKGARASAARPTKEDAA